MEATRSRKIFRLGTGTGCGVRGLEEAHPAGTAGTQHSVLQGLGRPPRRPLGLKQGGHLVQAAIFQAGEKQTRSQCAPQRARRQIRTLRAGGKGGDV